MTYSRSRRLEGAAVVPFFCIATAVIFWPAFARPGREVFETPGALQADGFLITWILAWDCHALLHAPLHLFDANIFYPARATLAGSEHLLGHLPLFAPAYWLTGNPVFAIQFTRFMTISLCGVAMYALLRHWGARPAAALFGGFVYAYCPARYLTVHALQLVAMPYLPLALLFLDRAVTRGSWTAACLLFASLLLQMWCSFYLAYISVAAVAAYVAVTLWYRRPFATGSHWVPALVALGAAAGLFVLSATPYANLASKGDIPQHSQSLLVAFSAAPWSTYATRPQFGRFAPLGQAYVGFVPGLLSAIALVWGLRRSSSLRVPILSAAAVAAVMYVLALGPVLEIGSWEVPLPYALANRIVPGFSAMRVPLRFTFGFLVGLGTLSGLGFQVASRRFGTGATAAVAFVAMALTSLDFGHFAYRPRMQAAPGPAQVPEVYRRLAALEPGPTLEIPAALQGQDSFAALNRQARYQLLSTYHWNPLLNGYTGYPPPSAATILGLAKLLPEPRALELLQRMAGLRYVIVHLSELPPGGRREWHDAAGLERLGRYGDDLLLRVADPLPADLIEAVREGPAGGRTLLGNAVEHLSPSAATDVIEVVHPARGEGGVFAGLPVTLRLRVRNRSDSLWPVLTDAPGLAVEVRYRWWRGGSVVAEGAMRLPYDVGAGESAGVVGAIPAPAQVGDYGLELAVVQGNHELGAPARLGSVEVREIPTGL